MATMITTTTQACCFWTVPTSTSLTFTEVRPEVTMENRSFTAEWVISDVPPIRAQAPAWFVTHHCPPLVVCHSILTLAITPSPWFQITFNRTTKRRTRCWGYQVLQRIPAPRNLSLPRCYRHLIYLEVLIVVFKVVPSRSMCLPCSLLTFLLIRVTLAALSHAMFLP